MSKKEKVLVVDDKPDVCLSVNYLLSEHGFVVEEAYSPEEAIKAVKSALNNVPFSIVILDMNYRLDTTSGEEGLDLIARIKELNSSIEIVAMTAWSNVELAVKAIQLGASDFIEKPWEVNRLLQVVKQAGNLSRLKKEQRKYQALTQSEKQELVFESSAMQSLMTELQQIAQTGVNILLVGENGTGKSAIAKWIHQHSAVAEQPFVSVNMGAIPDSLFESELFGHVKGAFTDAKADRIGRFEMAESGTLFLDEIGTLSLEHQVKLLRVLEEKQFERVGSSESQSVSYTHLTLPTTLGV